MKKLLPTVIFCLLIFNWTELNFVYANKYVEIRNVLELKRQGWEVLEKQSEVESRPGQKPYQNLKREIHIVKYRLRKGKEFVFCLVEYDSQLDTIREACDVSQENAERRIAQ